MQIDVSVKIFLTAFFLKGLKLVSISLGDAVGVLSMVVVLLLCTLRLKEGSEAGRLFLIFPAYRAGDITGQPGSVF
jgi:hypothetical protein